MVVPEHIQIENVSNLCNARCSMCNINNWVRKKEVMDNEIFEKVVNRLLPYKKQIKFFTIQGTGEALIDKNLPSKIKYLSDQGFSNIGMPSNCELLDENMALALLDAKLNTLICSIDGITASTHESIRVGLNYDTILKNVLNFIKLRNDYKFSTKIIIRFVLQEKNYHEWEKFKKFWNTKINPLYKDEVQFINVHNWGDKMNDVGSLIKDSPSKDKIVCEELYKRLVINANADIAFCCVDDNKFFNLNNALKEDPIEIYNKNPKFIEYRQKMEEGNIGNLLHCKNCSVPIDRYLRNNNIGVYNDK